MRLLFWSPSFLPTIGGVEWLVHDLAYALYTRGHEVFVLDGNPQLGEEYIAPWLLSTRLPCPSYATCLREVRDSTLNQLRQLLGDLAPEIVHLQFLGTQTYYALELKHELGFKLVATAQGSDLNFLAERSRSRQRMIARCLREADVFTACSSELMACAVALLPTLGGTATIIPNGVKEQFFETRSSTGIQYDVLVCANLRYVKGVDVLLEAYSLAQLANKRGLLIVGDGLELNALRKQSLELGIAELVTFHGSCLPGEFADLLTSCTLCAIPSRQEGMPLVALEAMASGKALVASSVGGLIQLVRNGFNGLLVEPGDAAAMAEALEELLSDPILCRKMGQRSRQLAEAYHINNVALQYERVYASLFH